MCQELRKEIFDEAKATKADLIQDQAIQIASQKLDEKTQKIKIQEDAKNHQTGGRKPIPEDYARVDVIHYLKDHEKICTCGCALTQFVW